MVLVGWEGGDPQRPHAVLWEAGATVLSLKVTASQIMLGGADLAALLDGVLTGRAVDPFTGLTHAQLGNSSGTVLAKR